MFVCQGNTNYWEFKRNSLKATLVSIFLHIFLDSSAVIGIWSLSNSFIISFRKMSHRDFCFIAQIYVSYYKIFSQYFGFFSLSIHEDNSFYTFLSSLCFTKFKSLFGCLSNNVPRLLCLMIYGLTDWQLMQFCVFFFSFLLFPFFPGNA